MTNEEIRTHLESLTGHVRALQAAVTQLVRLSVKNHTNEAVRDEAARFIIDDNLPMKHADYASRDDHAVALDSLAQMFAHRPITQLPPL